MIQSPPATHFSKAGTLIRKRPFSTKNIGSTLLTYGRIINRFFDAFSSPDLINWTKHSSVLDSAAIKWAKRAMWAPAVVEKNRKYYFFFGANDIQSNKEYGGIGVAVADKPEGPFKDYLGKPWSIHLSTAPNRSISLFLKTVMENTILFMEDGAIATSQTFWTTISQDLFQ